MRSKKHEYEEEWHVQQLVLRHTPRRCEERQHMYRKGGRGTHQEHWNPQRCGRSHFLPVRLGVHLYIKVSKSVYIYLSELR